MTGRIDNGESVVGVGVVGDSERDVSRVSNAIPIAIVGTATSDTINHRGERCGRNAPEPTGG